MMKTRAQHGSAAPAAGHYAAVSVNPDGADGDGDRGVTPGTPPPSTRTTTTTTTTDLPRCNNHNTRTCFGGSCTCRSRVLFGLLAAAFVTVVSSTVYILTSLSAIHVTRQFHHSLLSDPAFHLAQCWGNRSHLPNCPFDHKFQPLPQELFQPADRDQITQRRKLKYTFTEALDFNPPGPIRVLYLSENFWEYTHRNDRYYYDEVFAASRHPMLKVTMWGKGFPGWKDDKSLVDNIEATFGARDYFDIVYTMPNGVQDLFPVNTVYVHSMGDCHGAEWEVDCEKSTWPLATPDVIVSRYAFEIFDLFNWERAKEKNRTRPILRGHHPDCADPEKLFPLPINQTREVDVQLFGAVWELYPIRMAVADAIKKELIRGKIFSHQGYFGDEKVEPTNSSLLTLPPGSVDPTDPALAHIHARYAVYAAALRNTRICVFDSSKIHKAIRKFHEAMLSGCVVASDMPDEMEDEVFRGVIIRLERHWDGQRIKQELEWYLKRPQLLDRMAIEAFKRAREHLVCEKRVDRLLQLAARARRGDVGYWFPYGFTGGCREYTDQRKPDWCP